MIRVLSRDVVERIAAGEVIERPASVIKELVENCLDAGATRIAVEIEKGGKQLIRVSDDGGGMDVEDLRLAFVPHATSKLTEVDDLLRIASYGFRGEALSSIAAVSRARLVSRLADRPEGHEVTCESGVGGEVRPCGAAPGTIVEVRNLFFNVPARARFLKGDAAEASRCLDHVIRVALVSDGIAFSMKVDGRAVFDVPGNATRRERLARAYGRELGEALIAVSRRFDDRHVEALLGTPAMARPRTSHQHLFVNGRLVKDATMHAAVRQAFREFLAPSLQPVYALFLTIDPAEVDVNVHPAKIEVRFRDGNGVFRAVYHVVLEALRNADLAPRPGAAAPPARSLSNDLPLAPEPTAGTVREPPPPLPEGLPGLAGRTPEEILPIRPLGDGVTEAPPEPSVPDRSGRGWLRLFQTYVLYEAGTDLVCVDQHALHERVLYERLRRQLRDGPVQRQRLLIPEVVEVGRPDVLRLEEIQSDLEQLGLEVTAFGETSVAIHAVPVLLKQASPADLLGAALAPEETAGSATRTTLEERLHTLACRSAVKAGDHLQDSEIEALLGEAAKLPEAKACPHGRPTSIRISRADLERWFKRTGF